MARKKNVKLSASAGTEKAPAPPAPTRKESEPSAPTPGVATSSGDGEERRREMSVVGIGASAGGLEALTGLLQAIPAESGLAFVVISHLDPEHKSALGEILSRTCAMPVRDVEEGMLVESDHVYVMPPNQELVLARKTLHLAPRPESRAPHMPVDVFLRSLAAERGSRAIAVILSGTGSDGTYGAKAIKEAGGINFAQDESARFGGMPHSAVTAGCIDYVLPPRQIAAELLRIAHHPLQARPIQAGPPDESEFHRILRLMSEFTGVDFLSYKHSTLRRRIERRMLLLGLQTLDDYLEFLREDAAERKKLFDEVLIQVTSFFRDPDSFESLKQVVFPRLMQNRQRGMPLRIWVPGCASGEEAYSLAILLLEFLRATSQTAPIKIFATDISERAVESARAGAYAEGIAAEVSPQRLQRFFTKTDRGYEINKSVRDLCVFARQDVTKDPPFSQLDLISCRNVLIYLGPGLQSRVLPMFHYALKPGSFLVLGNSESVGAFTDLFEAADRRHKFFVRTATPSRLTFGYTAGAPSQTRVVVQEAGIAQSRGLPDVYREADRVVLARYAPPGVVVDENLHVVQFRGETGRFLKPAPGPPTAELIQLAREGLIRALNNALDRAKRDNVPVQQAGVRFRTNSHFQQIELHVIPIADLASGARHFVVLFEEVPAKVGAEGAEPEARAAVAPEEESEKEREVNLLKQDLEATKAYLQSVIEQKEGAIEELRAANEEIVSANEELQSTNEELETAKEELQATNEELTTVNEELQNRIRTANQLSDDLVNLIECTNIPVLVLDVDLNIRRFTPTAQRALNLRPGDLGRPIGDLKLKFDFPQLESLAREVIDTLKTAQREVLDEQGRWHSLHIRPYKTADNKIGGVIVMLIDVDVLKRRERQVKESLDYALSIVETVREALIVLDGQLRVRTANRAFYQMFRARPAETEGRLIYELGDQQWDIPRLRTLLEELLPQNRHFENYELEHDFPLIGRRTMLLNAHRVIQLEGEPNQLILLAIEDVTARKHAEDSQQDSEHRLEAIVNSAVDAIITIDEHGIIGSVNPATERMFGYLAAEMIGQNVAMLMPSPYREQHNGYLARYLQTGENQVIGVSREVQGRRKDGSSFPTELSVSEFQQGPERLFAGVHHDLSARRALEREVLETATAEQRRIAQELHDTTGQELTALGLLAESLIEGLAKNAPAEAALAGKIAAGLKQTLSQVRMLARGLIPVEVDAAGLMAALAELASHTDELGAAKCTFECHKPVFVESNQTATQLFAIAREAVTNALRHSQAKHITISLESDDRTVTLRVRDDGVGFPPEEVEEKGMGLKTMRYRAGLSNAALSIVRAEPAGALISCTVHHGPNHDAEQNQDA